MKWVGEPGCISAYDDYLNLRIDIHEGSETVSFSRKTADGDYPYRTISFEVLQQIAAKIDEITMQGKIDDAWSAGKSAGLIEAAEICEDLVTLDGIAEVLRGKAESDILLQKALGPHGIDEVKNG